MTNETPFDISSFGPDVLLSPEQAAKALGRSTSTLAKQRLSGNGCPYIKQHGKVHYAVGDVRVFIAAHRRVSTIDTGLGSQAAA